MYFEKQSGIPAFECIEYFRRSSDYVVLIPMINKGTRIARELARAKSAIIPMA